MMQHVMTATCLACVGTFWAWLANPKRTYADKMLTAALTFAVIILVLTIFRVPAAQWGG